MVTKRDTAPCKVCKAPRDNHVYDKRETYTHDYERPHTDGKPALVECKCGLVFFMDHTPFTIDESLASLNKEGWKQVPVGGKRQWQCSNCAPKTMNTRIASSAKKTAKANARNKQELR